MRKSAIENVYVEGEVSVGDVDNLSLYERPEIDNEDIDKIDMEKMIYFLSADENLVLLFKHLGYKSNEIYKIMGLSNISKYYKFDHNLRMRIYLFKTFNNLEKPKKQV